MVAIAVPDVRPTPYLPLGRRLAEARRALRLSQVEVAARVGLHQTAVSHFERGRNRPEPDVLRMLARALLVDYQELAALAGYIDRPTGEATIAVPADNLGLRRDVASAPPGILRRIWDLIAEYQEQSARELNIDRERDAEGA